MITRMQGLLGQAASRYHAAERRILAGRVGRWSTRRRWVALVLVPLLTLGCCGGVVGVPLVWLLRETVAAGQGAPAPDAAADAYLQSLSYGNADGLLPLLDDEHQDELLAGWRAYRTAMESTQPRPPFRLGWAGLDVGQVIDGHAEVTTEVDATWWDTDEAGRNISYDSARYTWRIEVREDDGWRVTAVHAPAWCGGYVRADACG